jgi:hypothetical protein
LRYPAPQNTIVEPFAGSAGYSLHHHDRHVHLFDVDPVIVGVWRYLIRATAAEVLALPDLAGGQTTADLAVPQEARWLIGFWLNKGAAAPRTRPSAWLRSGIRPNSTWGQAVRERIASQLPAIRHWRIEQRNSLEEVPAGFRATWFVDPPYQGDAGRHYVHDAIDFARLAAWCRSLDGHVIVCEQAGADWLPFRPLASIKSTRGTSDEVVWTS